MATLPEFQGRGIGSSLVVHVLRLSDAAGFGSYVEGSSDGAPLYAKMGWVTKGEVPIPNRTGRLSCMLREPYLLAI
jgi:GNAT superfamily N-acetyltransferase